MKVICQLSKEAERDYSGKFNQSIEEFVENLKKIVSKRLELRSNKDKVVIEFIDKEQLK